MIDQYHNIKELVFMKNEQINVFISSSMGENQEPFINWSKVRDSLSPIQDNPLFCLFRVENHASSDEVQAYFKRHVEESDIFIIFIGDVIRDGTYSEYVKAQTLEKPMLIYFNKNSIDKRDPVKLKDGDKMTSSEFRNEVFSSNEHTIRLIDLDNFNYKVVYNDLLAEVHDHYINYFSKSDPHYVQSSQLVKQLTGDYKLDILKPLNNILQNTILNQKQSEDIPNIGVNLINWLLNGDSLPDSDDLGFLIKPDPSLNKMRDILVLRWESTQAACLEKYSSALSLQEYALKLAKSKDAFPKWLLYDILLDCRNFAFSVAMHKTKDLGTEDAYKKYQKYQNSLQKEQPTIFPLLDRYKSIASDQLSIEMEKYRLQARGTKNFGSLLPEILNQVQNYFLTALIFGSYSHVIDSRSLLTRTLQEYGLVAKDTQLIIQSAKLNFVNGDYDTAIKLLNKNWKLVGTKYSSKINAIFDIFNNDNINNRFEGEFGFISQWGQLLNDKNVQIAKNDIMNMLAKSNISLNIASEMRLAILRMAKRFSPDELLNIIHQLLVQNKVQNISIIPELFITYPAANYDSKQLQINLHEAKPNFKKISQFGGDISKLMLLFTNEHQLDPQTMNEIINAIKSNSSEIKLIYWEYYSTENQYTLTELLEKLSGKISEWLNNSHKEGRFTYTSNNPTDYVLNILDKRITQKEADQIATFIVPFVEVSFHSENEDVIFRVLECVFLLIKQCLIYDLQLPLSLRKLSNIQFPKAYINNLLSVPEETRNSIYLFMAIKNILSQNNNWLSLLADPSTWSTEAYSLNLLDHINESQKLDLDEINLINSWLSSSNAEIINSIIPVVVKWDFKFNNNSFTNGLMKLRSNPYPKIRSSLLIWMNEFRTNSVEFKSILKLFINDPDYRIRELASTIGV